MRNMPPPCRPSRSPRSLICRSDSSPETYSTVCWCRPSRCATWRSRVLLPMPGSPPMRTIDPGTMPPPSTRSNSSIPELIRSASEASTRS